MCIIKASSDDIKEVGVVLSIPRKYNHFLDVVVVLAVRSVFFSK